MTQSEHDFINQASVLIARLSHWKKSIEQDVMSFQRDLDSLTVLIDETISSKKRVGNEQPSVYSGVNNGNGFDNKVR